MKPKVEKIEKPAPVDIFEQTRVKLLRAKNAYQNAITQVDGDLRRLVSQDPKRLKEARGIQATYTDDINPVDLEAAEQPAAPRTRTAKKRTAKKSVSERLKAAAKRLRPLTTKE